MSAASRSIQPGGDGEAEIETLLKACKRGGVFARGYAQILDVQAEIRQIVTEAEARRRPLDYVGRYREAQLRLRHAERRFLGLAPQNKAEDAVAMAFRAACTVDSESD